MEKEPILKLLILIIVVVFMIIAISPNTKKCKLILHFLFLNVTFQTTDTNESPKIPDTGETAETNAPSDQR
jgi:hypothetical protein